MGKPRHLAFTMRPEQKLQAVGGNHKKESSWGIERRVCSREPKMSPTRAADVNEGPSRGKAPVIISASLRTRERESVCVCGAWGMEGMGCKLRHWPLKIFLV